MSKGAGLRPYCARVQTDIFVRHLVEKFVTNVIRSLHIDIFYVHRNNTFCGHFI